MAEGYINQTEGSGKKARTWQSTIGGNTVEEQYVLQGEPKQATYSVTQGPVLTTANSHLFQIMAGASLNVRIKRIEIWPSIAATAVAITTLQLFRLTSAGTGGTSVTPAVIDPSDGAAGATAMILPSSKGTETTLLWQGSYTAYQTLPTDGAIPAPIILDSDVLGLKGIKIAAGTSNGIALKNVTGISPAAVVVTIWFIETSY